MPICASVRRTASGEVSTRRMISSFSAAGYLIDILPIRDHAFFEQAVLEGGFGQRLFELARFGAQCLHLVRGCFPCRVTGEPFLAGFEELLGPTIVEVLGNALLAAQLGNAGLAAQAFEHDADLVLGRELAPGGSADISDGLLGAVRRTVVFVLIAPPGGYDELDLLPYAISSICPVSADGGHR